MATFEGDGEWRVHATATRVLSDGAGFFEWTFSGTGPVTLVGVKGDCIMNQAGSSSLVDEIIALHKDRKPKRVQIKYERMNANPFAFFRGTDPLFARAWSDLHPPDLGPPTMICGDLHLENFGAFRSDDGEFVYDINDFDEALLAPCSLDLVRCATSILLAAQEWQLTPLVATAAVLAFLDPYREAVAESGKNGGLAGMVTLGQRKEKGDSEDEGSPTWDLLGATAQGTQEALLDHQTTRAKSGKRRIRRLPDKYPPVSEKRFESIKQALKDYGKSKPTPAAYKVLDVTGRISGIGSLGISRYIALIEGDGSPDKNRLLDIKEALPSALASCTGHPQPFSDSSQAQRIVEAQRQLQAKPNAGLDVLPVDGKDFRVRELVPDENRSSLDHLRRKPAKLLEAVKTAGRITGWSQIRGSDYDGYSSLSELIRWSAGTALDAVLSAAVRYADRTRRDYEVFHEAYERGAFAK